MVVAMFTPSRGYGFCGDDAVDTPSNEGVYFSVEVFERLSPGGPPPIVGEKVEVVLEADSERPRANSVKRCNPPCLLKGVVVSFDAARGWGFLECLSTKEKYFLHRSEMESMVIPVRNQKASFYAGVRKGKKRACYVTLM